MPRKSERRAGFFLLSNYVTFGSLSKEKKKYCSYESKWAVHVNLRKWGTKEKGSFYTEEKTKLN